MARAWIRRRNALSRTRCRSAPRRAPARTGDALGGRRGDELRRDAAAGADRTVCARRRLSRCHERKTRRARALVRDRERRLGPHAFVRRHRPRARARSRAPRGTRLVRQEHESDQIQQSARSFSSAPCSRTPSSKSTRRSKPIAAARARAASMHAPPARSPRRARSMRRAAFRISRSSSRARFRSNFARRSAISFMAATFVRTSARGT